MVGLAFLQTLFDTVGAYMNARREGRLSQELARTFGEDFDPATLKTLQKLSALRPERRRVEFVAILICDDAVERVPALVGRAVGQAQQGGALVETVVGPLVLVTYGADPAPRDGPDAGRARRALAEQVGREFGGGAAVLHGQADALVGPYGHASRLAYGSILQAHAGVLRALAQLPSGRVAEWP